jgi:mRNA interferase MazF
LSQPVLRGEVYLADLKPAQGSEQDGVRPVLIISRDALNKFSPLAVIVPFTDAANKTKVYPSHVRFSAGRGGLTMESLAVCEQVRTISKTRLRKLMGKISPAEMAQVEAAIKIVLDLP